MTVIVRFDGNRYLGATTNKFAIQLAEGTEAAQPSIGTGVGLLGTGVGLALGLLFCAGGV